MQTFSELYQESIYKGFTISDKGTGHTYIDGYYNEVLNPLKEKSIKLLEIGVQHGGSMRLWRDFFIDGEIWGIDIKLPDVVIQGVNLLERDAYSQETLDMFEDNYFDIIIDDGPHTVESQVYCIKHWSSKLKVGGRLIVEDIQNIGNSYKLENAANEVGQIGTIYDLRSNKNFIDDVIFEIIKI